MQDGTCQGWVISRLDDGFFFTVAPDAFHKTAMVVFETYAEAHTAATRLSPTIVTIWPVLYTKIRHLPAGSVE